MAITPGKTIRAMCLQCVESYADVRECEGDKCDPPCLFYRYRMGKGRPSVKVIQKNCLVCMGNSSDLIKDRPSENCPSYPYRFGKSINRTQKPGKGIPPALLEYQKRREETGKNFKVERSGAGA